MAIRVGINGLGRIGRTALREWWGSDAFSIVHVNEIGGDAKSVAHLTKFDSVHGTWDKDIVANADILSPAYIVFNNYEIILKWNRSLRFSLAVCTLKDKFKDEL